MILSNFRFCMCFFSLCALHYLCTGSCFAFLRAPGCMILHYSLLWYGTSQVLTNLQIFSMTINPLHLRRATSCNVHSCRYVVWPHLNFPWSVHQCARPPHTPDQNFCTMQIYANLLFVVTSPRPLGSLKLR